MKQNELDCVKKFIQDMNELGYYNSIKIEEKDIMDGIKNELSITLSLKKYLAKENIMRSEIMVSFLT